MVVKAVPVASFIILVLIWVHPEFVGSDFIFDGISYSLHECVGRYSQYGS